METTQPTITETTHESSINDLMVEVEPYRTTDVVTGETIEVVRFYGNGGLISAEGFRVKNNGETYSRRQTVTVATPANVRAALGR